MMTKIKGIYLRRAYDWYVNGYLDEYWWISRNWSKYLPEMIFRYSIIGNARLGDGAADTFYEKAREGKRLPRKRHLTLKEASLLTSHICSANESNPVDWFTGKCGCVQMGWKSLDDIVHIGPKIASFIIRDLSFMRDYSNGKGKASVAYKDKRDQSWFNNLPYECQGLFLPIDVNVHSGARDNGVSTIFKKYDANTMQLRGNLYRKATTDIAIWASKHNFDPRDVNIYWYGIGAGYIDEEGRYLD